MHKMTRDVLRATQALEFQQFRDPDDRGRLVELRRLALDQVADDVQNMGGRRRDSIGAHDDGWVYVIERIDDGRPLWARRTEEQLNLEVTFAPMLRDLPTRQNEVCNLLYYGGLSLGEVAAALGVTKTAVVTARDRALTALRRVIVERFNLEGVPEHLPEPTRHAPASGREGSCNGRVFPTRGSTFLFDVAWLDEPYVPVPRTPLPHLTFAGAS